MSRLPPVSGFGTVADAFSVAPSLRNAAVAFASAFADIGQRRGPTRHFFRIVTGQLNGQLLRFIVTVNQKYIPPIRSNAFNSLVWYPRHRRGALKTRSARPRAPRCSPYMCTHDFYFFHDFYMDSL